MAILQEQNGHIVQEAGGSKAFVGENLPAIAVNPPESIFSFSLAPAWNARKLAEAGHVQMLFFGVFAYAFI